MATHSSLVCSRLDLRSAILFTDFDIDPIKPDKLPEDTAKFFMKAPSNAILEFVLSKRNLLVEGDAEYILMSEFFKKATGDKLSGSGVNVISIGGLSFARYLDVANVLNIRTAVITDNDGELQKNCIDRYEKYADANHIQIFCDDDNERYTFEVCVYQDNKEICDELFLKGRRKLSVQEYMLKNKSTAAFTLASKKSDKITVPSYIKNAVKWVRE